MILLQKFYVHRNCDDLIGKFYVSTAPKKKKVTNKWRVGIDGAWNSGGQVSFPFRVFYKSNKELLI